MSVPSKSRAVLRWISIAVVTAVVTLGGITVYQSSISTKQPGAAEVSGNSLPPFEKAFPEQTLSGSLRAQCSNLSDVVESGLGEAELQDRVNMASTATRTEKSARKFVAAHGWVFEAKGPETWLAGITRLMESKLGDLAPHSSDPAIQSANKEKLSAAYSIDLQSHWLTECHLAGDFAAKRANLISYRQVSAAVLAKSAESENSESEAKPETNPDTRPSAKPGNTPPSNAGVWPPSGLKLVPGFANFAYKSVNDFCSVGTVCAKFKVISKAKCSSGAAIDVEFLDAAGKVLDKSALAAAVRNSSSVVVEADTDVTQVAGWQISNISCK